MEKHKSKPAQFGSVAVGVKQRLEKNIETRKNTRFAVFDKIRGFPECQSRSSAPLTELQLTAERKRLELKKWKEEKEKKKREAAAHKKKPFIAGVVHSSLRFVPPPVPPKQLPAKGRVKGSQTAKNMQTNNLKLSEQEFNGKTFPFLKLTDTTPEKSEPITKFEVKSSSPKDWLKTPEQIIKEPNRISPRVTLSRGEDNGRREMKKEIDKGLLDKDASDMDSVYDFRHQLDSEVKRMMELCDTWDKIMEQTQLPDNVQEAVLAATGQARLLVSAKLQQFAGLLERCARPVPGLPLVTRADLSGFWDMVFMQIEDIYSRFKKLEQLRSRDWEEEQTVQQKKKVAPARIKKSNKPAPGPSRLREMIAAARKAKKEQEAACAQLPSTPPSDKSPVRASPPPPLLPASPAFALTSTPPSLLKKVLSNETKKYSASKSSAYAMLRASSFSKTIEIEGIVPLEDTPKPTPNAHITPFRSIMKSTTNVASAQISGKKSVMVVLLYDHDNDLGNSLAEKEHTDENTGQKEEKKISDQSQTEEETHVTSATSMDIQK